MVNIDAPNFHPYFQKATREELDQWKRQKTKDQRIAAFLEAWDERDERTGRVSENLAVFELEYQQHHGVRSIEIVERARVRKGNFIRLCLEIKKYLSLTVVLGNSIEVSITSISEIL